ncbi:hypothetical protein CDAR_610861 [Caerostris darwini]|uniref:Uncharacterized protein n=1 Tax=Caerostris darwini TaxID=1538125 RepID=A0AAV4Q271_9ARAC|nr:hypothetical protein CDAR_610861 [Caerostris darwini]
MVYLLHWKICSKFSNGRYIIAREMCCTAHSFILHQFTANTLNALLTHLSEPSILSTLKFPHLLRPSPIQSVEASVWFHIYLAELPFLDSSTQYRLSHSKTKTRTSQL